MNLRAAIVQIQSIARGDPQMPSLIHGAAVHVDGRDLSGRIQPRLAIGAHPQQAAAYCDPHIVAAALDPPHLQRLQTRIERYLMHAAIHLAHKHAKAGADPQLSVWFGQQGTHGAESFIRILPQRIAHMLEMPAIGKHAIEPGIRSHPQIAVRRLRYRPYVIAGQALWIRRIMTPMLETTALPFVTIEPRTESSHPQLVVVIREQAVHRTLGQRRRVVRVMAESLEINAVIAH